MLLRYLKLITLKKATKIKNSNGTYTNSYTKIDDYKVQMQDLTDDEISASVYGANIIKMFQIFFTRIFFRFCSFAEIFK